MFDGCRGDAGSFPTLATPQRRRVDHAVGHARGALGREWPDWPVVRRGPEGRGRSSKIARTCNSTIAAGRVAGVITERAVSNPRRWFLAGGAWSAACSTQTTVFDAATLVRENVAATEPLPESLCGCGSDGRVRIPSPRGWRLYLPHPVRRAVRRAGCVPRVASLYDQNACPSPFGKRASIRLHPKAFPRCMGNQTALAAGPPSQFEANAHPGSPAPIWQDSAACCVIFRRCSGILVRIS